MDIKSTAAAQAYTQAQSKLAVGTKETTPDANPTAQFAADFVTTMQQSEATAKAGLVGKADPHSVVEALAATELAVQTAVTVRDKVVEAYQEILRMPV